MFFITRQSYILFFSWQYNVFLLFVNIILKNYHNWVPICVFLNKQAYK